ncbi:unnamed protein product [Nyctereutes procyonoides]|uniref:(raccoon dog) hypothetical protein n=1 Tax=Nyctereutes procyonoides TaxID=34880 RepID=A0A811ZV05_NYCPR|nr:unnamed protein product [Nyctereutes procyonoides]
MVVLYPIHKVYGTFLCSNRNNYILCETFQSEIGTCFSSFLA